VLEPLEDLDDFSPSTKCCPMLSKHLDISLGVFHGLFVVVLEPEWSNDFMFGDGNSGQYILQSVIVFADSVQGGVLKDVVLRVDVT